MSRITTTGVGAVVAVVLVAVLSAEAMTAQPAGSGNRPQSAPLPAQPANGGPALVNDDAAPQTRERFRSILRQFPPSLSEVLRLDPSLLTDARYLAPYPALTGFLADHPDVVRNPSFFLGPPQFGREDSPTRQRLDLVESLFAGLAVLTGLMALLGVLVWVIKLLVDHRRWSRMARIQTDAHTKVLDRLTTNDDLLAYIQTPAGRGFLASSPIPLDAAPAVSAPVGRILWSVQAGTVAAALGIGLLYVSARFAGDTTGLGDVSPFLFMIGTVIVAVGIGFLLSSVIAYLVSRRLGLFAAAPTDAHA